MLEDQARLVSFILQLVFFVRNLPNLIAPHHLGLVCGPLSWFRVPWPFAFLSQAGVFGNMRNESDDQLGFGRVIVLTYEANVVTV